ncbi:MAG: hypothetical protein WB711_23000 [Terriglobales bacterium]
MHKPQRGIQQPPVPGGSKFDPNARPANTIYLRPNPNDDGYEDNWVCEHIDMQPGQYDGASWLCDACATMYNAGATIVKQGK